MERGASGRCARERLGDWIGAGESGWSGEEKRDAALRLGERLILLCCSREA